LAEMTLRHSLDSSAKEGKASAWLLQVLDESVGATLHSCPEERTAQSPSPTEKAKLTLCNYKGEIKKPLTSYYPPAVII